MCRGGRTPGVPWAYPEAYPSRSLGQNGCLPADWVCTRPIPEAAGEQPANPPSGRWDSRSTVVHPLPKNTGEPGVPRGEAGYTLPGVTRVDPSIGIEAFRGLARSPIVFTGFRWVVVRVDGGPFDDDALVGAVNDSLRALARSGATAPEVEPVARQLAGIADKLARSGRALRDAVGLTLLSIDTAVPSGRLGRLHLAASARLILGLLLATMSKRALVVWADREGLRSQQTCCGVIDLSDPGRLGLTAACQSHAYDGAGSGPQAWISVRRRSTCAMAALGCCGQRTSASARLIAKQVARIYLARGPRRAAPAGHILG